MIREGSKNSGGGATDVKQREDFEMLERRISVLFAAVSDGLPLEVRRDVTEFLDAHVYYLALDLLCYGLVDVGATIDEAQFAEIDDLATRMGERESIVTDALRARIALG
ncbi:MAG: MafI family immunity protein [Planctomycetota bacterium]